MPSNLKPYRFGPFPFGVNRNCDPIYGQMPGQMQRGEVYDALNVRMPTGLVNKRPGFALMGSALTGVIQALYDYVDLLGVHRTLAIGTTGAWSWSDSTGLWTSLGTLHGSASKLVRLCVFNGTVVLCNQSTTDGLQSITSGGSLTAITGSGAPSSARSVQGYENHLLVIDPVISGTEYPYRIMWGDFNSITNFASGDASIVDLLDISDPLYDIDVFGQYGVLYRGGSIYNILPAASPAFYQFQQQVVRAGLAGLGSKAQTSIGAPYLSLDDLYIYNGSGSNPFGGGNLRPVLNAGGIGYALLSQVVAAVQPTDAEYWVAYPSQANSTQNDKLAIVSYQGVRPGSPGYCSFYDLKATALGSRAGATGLTWNRATKWPNYAGVGWNTPSVGSMFPLMMYANGPQVYQQQPQLDDAGSPINAYVTTGLTDFGLEVGEKELQRIQVLLNNEPPISDATVTVYVLTSDDGNIQGATTWGPFFGLINTPNEVWIDCDIVAPAQYFAVQVLHDLADHDFGLRDVIGYWRPRGTQ